MGEKVITGCADNARETGNKGNLMALIGMTVGGGLTGLMHGMLGLSAVFAGNGLSRDVLCKLALSAFLLVSGVLFVTSRRLTRPLMVSLLLQIPLVSSPFIGYRFFAGLMVVVYFVDGNIGAIDRAGAEFWFEYRPETAPLGVGVNLVALILLVLLLRNQAIQYE